MERDDYQNYDEYFCIGFSILKLIKTKISCQYFCSLPAITILIKNVKVIPNQTVYITIPIKDLFRTRVLQLLNDAYFAFYKNYLCLDTNSSLPYDVLYATQILYMIIFERPKNMNNDFLTSLDLSYLFDEKRINYYMAKCAVNEWQYISDRRLKYKYYVDIFLSKNNKEEKLLRYRRIKSILESSLIDHELKQMRSIIIKLLSQFKTFFYDSYVDQHMKLKSNFLIIALGNIYGDSDEFINLFRLKDEVIEI
ncbi:hypothetical protein COBT_003150 [Conglomerata obtusa]